MFVSVCVCWVSYPHWEAFQGALWDAARWGSDKSPILLVEIPSSGCSLITLHCKLGWEAVICHWLSCQNSFPGFRNWTLPHYLLIPPYGGGGSFHIVMRFLFYTHLGAQLKFSSAHNTGFIFSSISCKCPIPTQEDLSICYFTLVLQQIEKSGK